MANTHRKAAFVDGVTARGEGAMHGAPPVPGYGRQTDTAHPVAVRGLRAHWWRLLCDKWIAGMRRNARRKAGKSQGWHEL